MKTIDEDIRSGNLKQIYLLYGTEDYLKRQYRDKLKNALTAAGEDSGMGGMLSGGDGDMNFNRFEGKDINPKQVIDLAETLPFFAERRVILIENSGFFKKAFRLLRGTTLSGGVRVRNFVHGAKKVSK